MNSALGAPFVHLLIGFSLPISPDGMARVIRTPFTIMPSIVLEPLAPLTPQPGRPSGVAGTPDQI